MPFGQKITQTTTIPGRSAQENQLMALLRQLLEQSAGQLGDLGGLAGGQLGGPTAQEQDLIRQSIGRAGEFAQNQLRTTTPVIAAQQREQLAARGAPGSGETVAAILQGLGQQQAVTSSILQAQQEGGQALLNLPLQRAGLQLSANQQLFNQIAGLANPLTQIPLQERLAQKTTTQEESGGFGLQQLMQLGSLAASGGASLGLAGLFGGGGGQNFTQTSPGRFQLPNQFGGYQIFDAQKFRNPFTFIQ